MRLLKRLLLILVTVLFFPTSSYAEIKTYTHTIKQAFGGAQSPDDARIAAIAKAKREVLEKAGTYLESMTVVQNKSVTLDEVLSIAAGILQVEIVSQKNYASENGFGVIIVTKMDVDLSLFEVRVSNILEDRTLLGQYHEIEEQNSELLSKIAKLEEENRKLRLLLAKEKVQKEENIKKEFHKVTKSLTANQWARKATALVEKKKYEEAIICFTKAIEIEPSNTKFYANRASSYLKIKKYDAAIKDYTKRIEIDPKNNYGYRNRAAAYQKYGELKKALDDYSTAIEIDKNNPATYRPVDYFTENWEKRSWL